MIKMTNEQIDNLNELLIDNGEALTAFYDETIDVGIRKGFIIGVSVSLINVIVICGIKKLISKKNKTKIIE